jgi:hypothetical protein
VEGKRGDQRAEVLIGERTMTGKEDCRIVARRSVEEAEDLTVANCLPVHSYTFTYRQECAAPSSSTDPASLAAH